ncbi:F-box domain protein [Aspergillus novofumigatus IBT 16806]|uniref:F-box domain protein n=1 Tax=Aspergillus novofumigatus (strain IBT 16806) TaxID=1392255 RepID=A0A2I1BXY0_ASPN1|nr:F-box domain protein [Aspergillus novofumigatus IBT 16806]PKX90235.1 F-box domain protein [Aspergillus novofumigatus IBT 16806]
MGSLLNLPAEILLFIIGFFESAEDWPVLLSLCLTSRQLLHIGGTWGQMNIIQADTLSLFLSSSCLEYFSLSLLDVQGAGDSGFMHSSQSLNIASVSLTRMCIDTDILTTLIYACKGLKTLIYEIDSDTPNLVEPSDLAAILNSQSETLESIIVDLGLWEWGLHWDDYPKIESFALFTNLQHLEIEQCLLTDNPELPDSLRHLVIRACEHPVARLLTNLAKRSFDSLDSLALVVLQPQSSPPNGMFGLSERFDSDEDVHSNILYRFAFRRACKRVRKIVREACFDFDIRCEEWVLFEEGLL